MSSSGSEFSSGGGDEYKNFRQMSRHRLLNEMLRSPKVKESNTPWKVLIMDKFTVKIMSYSCKIADITDAGISLIEDVFKRREPMTSMDAVYFLQPLKENVIMVLSDMSGRCPLCRKAYIFFSSPVPKELLVYIKNDTSIIPRIGVLSEMNLEYFAMDTQALEVVDVDQQTKMMHELAGFIMRYIIDQNGNHVIQKCIECIPRDKIMFLISSFLGRVVEFSTNPHGYRVIQRILEYCDDAEMQRTMMAEIMPCIITLAQDQYGNYVIQHILQHGNPEERSVIITKLVGQIVKMSQQKFAYKVVEKCLNFGTQEERQILINEILGTTYENESLQVMVKDEFANYVVQKVLETCNEIHRQLILSRITTYLSVLKKSNPAKNIILRIEKLISAGGRIVSLGWSDLDCGILGLIAKKLNDINEFVYFRAVCKRWKSASERIEDQPQVLPWYLQSIPIYEWPHSSFWQRNIWIFKQSPVVPNYIYKKLHNSRDAKIFALHSSTVCKIRSDDMLYKRVEGFSERYLLIHDFFENTSSLFNPLTKTRILIPNFIPNWSGESYILYMGPNSNIDSVPANNYQILIIYFSVERGREGEGDVEEEEEVVVEEENYGKAYVIVYAFTEFELAKKRKIRVPYDNLSVTYWNDKLFVFWYNDESSVGETKVFSLVTGNQIYVITEKHCYEPFYTFNASGFLMRVIEYDEKMEVYRLVESGTQGKWEKLLGIGDHVLFVGDYNRCLARKASDIGLKANCIYGAELRNGKYVICRYDLNNNDQIVLPFDIDFAGTWFVPCVY